MAELAINQLIKIILGVIVFVVVVSGIYLLFKNYFIDFFKNIPSVGNNTLLILLK